jgi:hypothetical protein
MFSRGFSFLPRWLEGNSGLGVNHRQWILKPSEEQGVFSLQKPPCHRTEKNWQFDPGAFGMALIN